MTVILNEVKKAEHILELDKEKNKRESVIGSKPSYTLQLLARYFKQVMHLNDKEITERLEDIMKRNYKDYNKVLWENKIEQCVKKAAKTRLNEIDGIGITRKELDLIASLNNIDQEKLVFSMLCYAKFYNTINPKNNSWINVSLTELFKTARVYSKKDYNNKLVINDVKDLYDVEKVDTETGEITTVKWITLATLIESNNIKLNFVDDSTDYELIVDDYRELGYTYLKYKTGDSQYKHCKYCGVLFKSQSKKNNEEYCKEHRDMEQQEFRKGICVDCGEEFTVYSKDTKTCRCEDCLKEHKKILRRERDKKYRENKKNDATK